MATGQESLLEDVQLLYALHEEDVGVSTVDREEEIVQRGTMKVVRLSILPGTSKKSKPGAVSSKSSLILKERINNSFS